MMPAKTLSSHAPSEATNSAKTQPTYEEVRICAVGLLAFASLMLCAASLEFIWVWTWENIYSSWGRPMVKSWRSMVNAQPESKQEPFVRQCLPPEVSIKIFAGQWCCLLSEAPINRNTALPYSLSTQKRPSLPKSYHENKGLRELMWKSLIDTEYCVMSSLLYVNFLHFSFKS